MSQSKCIGLPPTDWSASIVYPRAIVTGLVYGLVLWIPLIGFYRFHQFTKHKIDSLSDEEFLALPRRKNIGIMPGIIYLLAIFILYYTSINNLFSTFLYYVFLADGGDNQLSMACYLQWYSDGNLVYGYLTAIIITIYIVILFLTVSYWLRPLMIRKSNDSKIEMLLSIYKFLYRDNAGQQEAGGFKNATAKDKTYEILFADSYDGLRGSFIAKGLYEAHRSDPNSFPSFNMSFADKYGRAEGDVDIDSVMIQRIFQNECGEEKCSIIKIPAELDRTTHNVWQLPKSEYGKYDIICVSEYVFQSSGLNIQWMGTAEEVKIKRVTFFLSSLKQGLAEGGYMFFLHFHKEKIETLRKILSDIGMNSNEHDQVMESDYHLPFGLCPSYRYKRINTETTIYANLSKEASTTTTQITSEMSIGDTTGGSILSATEVHRLYFFWIGASIALYLLIFAITVRYWNKLEFPAEMGFSNYFAWNLLSFINSGPAIFSLDFTLLYSNMMSVPSPTSSRINHMGAGYIISAFLLSFIQSLPGWIVTALFKYYLLQEAFGIPVNSFLSTIITVAFIFALTRLAFFFYRRANPFVEKTKIPNEIDVTLSTAASMTTRSTAASMTTRSTELSHVSSTTNPLKFCLTPQPGKS